MPTPLQNPFVIVLFILIILLGMVITFLAGVLLRRAGGRRNQAMDDKMAETGAGLLLPIAGGAPNAVFYVLVSILILELLVIMALGYNLWVISAIGRKGELEPGRRFGVPATRRWWRFYGSFSVLLLVFGCLWAIEMWRTPKPLNERTVKILSSPKDLAAGKAVFQGTCFVCHGKNGEGGIGPNLTDDYWLHGGSIQDIFRTIKYGWPEKGMKSWKDDYSPEQIAQIASYVKSLGGSHPANPKPPQGNLYKP